MGNTGTQTHLFSLSIQQLQVAQRHPDVLAPQLAKALDIIIGGD